MSNKLPFGKQDFKYFIGYKDDKKLYPYAYSIEKSVHIEEILIKDEKSFHKYSEIWEKVSITKKN